MEAGKPLTDGSPRRLRCASCGNLTRFDVVRVLKSRCFFHYDLGGRLQVEEEEILSEELREIRCRWCGESQRIEILAQPSSLPSRESDPPA
jgi:phage FluMu protein Com